MDHFIENYQLLKEDHHSDDLIGLDDAKAELTLKLQNIKYSGLIGIVSPFGTGKSTLLHQIQTARKDQERWIEFDAWKFPDRKDLWEGFILEVAKNINEGTFDLAIRRVEGKQNKEVSTAINTVGSIPGLSIIKNLNDFVDTSPATRVFELQKILTDIFGQETKDIFIIVEDIDRSGDAGIFFLETLKQYLQTLGPNKRIVCIVPMATDNYYANQESYLKCLDYVDFLKQKAPSLKELIKKTILPELVQDEIHVDQVAVLFEAMFEVYPGTTIRHVKNILRKADINFSASYERGDDPDWRVMIGFEAARYCKNETGYLFDTIKKDKYVPGDSILGTFLALIKTNTSNIRGRQNNEINYSTFGVHLTPRNPSNNFNQYPSVPYSSFSDDSSYFLPDFYLNY